MEQLRRSLPRRRRSGGGGGISKKHLFSDNLDFKSFHGSFAIVLRRIIALENAKRIGAINLS